MDASKNSSISAHHNLESLQNAYKEAAKEPKAGSLSGKKYVYLQEGEFKAMTRMEATKEVFKNGIGKGLIDLITGSAKVQKVTAQQLKDFHTQLDNIASKSAKEWVNEHAGSISSGNINNNAVTKKFYEILKLAKDTKTQELGMQKGEIVSSGVPKDFHIDWKSKNAESSTQIIKDLFLGLATGKNYAKDDQNKNKHENAMATLENEVVKLGWASSSDVKKIRQQAESEAKKPSTEDVEKGIPYKQPYGSIQILTLLTEKSDPEKDVFGLDSLLKNKIGTELKEHVKSLSDKREQIENEILKGIPDTPVNIKGGGGIPKDETIASRSFNNYGLRPKEGSVLLNAEGRITSFVTIDPNGHETTIENKNNEGWRHTDGMIFQNASTERNHDYCTSSTSQHSLNLVFADGCGQSVASQQCAQKAANAAAKALKDGIKPENVSSLRDVAKQHLMALREAKSAATAANTGGEATMGQVSIIGGHAVVSWIGDCKAFVISNGNPRKCQEISVGSRGNLTDPTDSGGRVSGKENEPDDLRSLSVATLMVKPGDQIILMSDGIHDNLNPDNLGITPQMLDPQQFSNVTSWDAVDHAQGESAISKFMASQVLKLTQGTDTVDSALKTLQEHAYVTASVDDKIGRLENRSKFSEGGHVRQGKADNANAIGITIPHFSREKSNSTTIDSLKSRIKAKQDDLNKKISTKDQNLFGSDYQDIMNLQLRLKDMEKEYP